MYLLFPLFRPNSVSLALLARQQGLNNLTTVFYLGIIWPLTFGWLNLTFS